MRNIYSTNIGTSRFMLRCKYALTAQHWIILLKRALFASGVFTPLLDFSVNLCQQSNFAKKKEDGAIYSWHNVAAGYVTQFGRKRALLTQGSACFCTIHNPKQRGSFLMSPTGHCIVSARCVTSSCENADCLLQSRRNTCSFSQLSKLNPYVYALGV